MRQSRKFSRLPAVETIKAQRIASQLATLIPQTASMAKPVFNLEAPLPC